MNEVTKGVLYNRRTAGGMSDLFNLINDIFENYEDLRWSSNRTLEYGFNYHDKKTKSILFLGIWFEAWELCEMPLCITVNWKGHAPNEKSDQIEKFVSDMKDDGLLFKNIDGLPTILFDERYFNFENDVERIGSIYEKLSEFVFPEHTNS